MNALAEIETARTQVARPLKVLAQLIKEDLEKARDAAERAGLPYYEAAGAKMLEAKPQLQHGEFQGWIKRNFAISADHARKYMQYAKARQNGFTKPVSSLSDFIQQTSSPSYNKPNTVRPREWHEPVKESIERARREFLLTQHGYQRTTISIKVCNPAEEVDRQAAIEQLSRLEARGEVTLSEAERIRHMLYLSAPNNGGER